MKFILLTVAAGIMLAPLASAQKLELKLDAIAARASDKSEVDLDGTLLKLALQHGLGKKDDKASAGDLMSGVQEIRIRNYEFDKPGAFSDSDLEPLRKQVSGVPGWSRIVNVKEKAESAEIFVYEQAGKITGCLILAAEAKELSVVYLVGTLTVAQMKELVDSHIAFNLAGLME